MLKIFFLIFMGAGIPVAIAMAGGYARDIADSVEIHAATLVAAEAIYSR